MFNDILKRSSLLWRIRNGVRSKFFGTLRRVASIDDTRDILSDAMALQNASYAARNMPDLENFESPYGGPDDEQILSLAAAREQRPGPIFITARFRTGSTLLWNLFRNIPGVTSYYEPLNERRWFDPSARGQGVDKTHLGVDEYWTEYRELAELGRYYSEDWTRRQLCMPASAWNPALERFIELMIERAPGRAVLQFNRVDLRLPWLRARFPQAKILHLYRNPRDQWASTLPKSGPDMRSLRIDNFQPFDGFYLLEWGRDLRHCFPFLTLDPAAHPYELFYQIWKLSYAYGRTHAHTSIGYESLVNNPQGVIRELVKEYSLENADPVALAAQVVDGKKGKWQTLADDAWFKGIERRVDQDFRRYFAHHAPTQNTVLPGSERLRAV